MPVLLLIAALQGPPSLNVYRVSPNVDIPVTLGVSLGSLLVYLYGDRLITPRCPCDPRDVNAFDRGAIGNTSATANALSDVTVGVAVVAPLLADAIDLGSGQRRAFTNDALVLAQTLAINGALVTLTKYLVVRPLPRTYAGDPDFVDQAKGYRSFYSGHTSLVFAALSASAMTIRLRYGERTWPWIVTVVVGTSVGIERVADGRHFPSDVLVGAVMGTAVGIVVPRLHARDDRRRTAPLVQPIPGGGVALGMTYPF